MHAAEMHRDLGLDERPGRRGVRRLHPARRRLALRDQGRADPRRPARPRPGARRARRGSTWCWRSCAPPRSGAASQRRARDCARRSASRRAPRRPTPSTGSRRRRARSCERMEDAGWDPRRRRRPCTTSPEVQRVLRFAATQVVPRLARTTDELDAVLHALDGGFIPAGPVRLAAARAGQRAADRPQLLHRRPARRAVPARVARPGSRDGRLAACSGTSTRPATTRASVGLCRSGARRAMRTSGDDIAEVLALLGVRPEWDEASRRVSELEVVPLEELGRPRIDVTVRISGFFRDAFPHVVAMLDDAVQLVAELDEPADQNYVRAHAQADLAEHGDERRATTRIFGSKPGSYGAGILQVVESGTWRDDNDLAEVYTRLGRLRLRPRPRRGAGRRRHARQLPADQGRGQEHRHPRARHRRLRRLLPVPRRHGRHRARADRQPTPRRTSATRPRPTPSAPGRCQEETTRVFRARVVNPRWIGAMQRHGYKGAFELAATVDYLFGFDATAGVVHDWMYETLAQEYVLDETNQEFMRKSNPWALRGIVERLHEAADRGLWAEPDPETLAAMQQVYLERRGRPGGPDEPDEGPRPRRRDGPAARDPRGRATRCASVRLRRWPPRSRTDDGLLARGGRSAGVHGDVPLVAVPDPERDRDDSGATTPARSRLARGAGGGVRAGRCSSGAATAAFLVWGDPSLYDSTIRIESIRLRAAGAGRVRRAARHQRPAAAGRPAPDRAARGRPAGAHHHRPPAAGGGRRRGRQHRASCSTGTPRSARRSRLEDWSIWWGANLGTDAEELVAGRVRRRPARALQRPRAARGRRPAG